MRLAISAYSDALAAVAVIDELEPKQVFGLFIVNLSWCACNKCFQFVDLCLDLCV